MSRPYCWICMSPAAVHVQGSSYVCADHAEGVGGYPHVYDDFDQQRTP